MTSNASDILRVHTDTFFRVWHGQNGVRAQCSHMSPEEFVTTKIFRGAQYVRVLGTSENARLIVRMYESRLQQRRRWQPSRIQLGSPSICFRNDMLLDPAFVLQQLWQPAQIALLPGCWHELSERDFATYYMLSAYQTNGERIDETVRRVATCHTAWTAVSFIPGFDVEAACRLICLVRDPRWYNHHHRPNRASRLLAYLGLTPQNFIPGDPLLKEGLHRDRAALVLRAWGGDRPCTGDIQEPKNFLRRIQRHAGGRGLLRASCIYIQFVRLVWLHGLAPTGRQVFDPEIFFKSPEETEAFLAHYHEPRSV